MTIRAGIASVLAVSMVACSSVRPVLKPAEFLSSHSVQRVWVTNNQNETYILTHPRLDGSNVVGMLQNSGEEMSIPLNNAQLVEAKQHDKKKTMIAAITLSAVGVGVIVLAVSAAAAADPEPMCPIDGC